MGSSTHAYAQTLRNAAHRIQQDDDDLTTAMDAADLDELTDDETNILNQAGNPDALLDAAVAEKLSQRQRRRQPSRRRQIRDALRSDTDQAKLRFTAVQRPLSSSRNLLPSIPKLTTRSFRRKPESGRCAGVCAYARKRK